MDAANGRLGFFVPQLPSERFSETYRAIFRVSQAYYVVVKKPARYRLPVIFCGFLK